MKTKVLLHQIGNKELVPWVNSELNGYPDGTEDLPPYRTVYAHPCAHVTYGYNQLQSFTLPVYHLTPKQRDTVCKLKITSSIGTIEQQVKTYRENQKGLIRTLPPEFASFFVKELTQGTNIISIWCEINMADMEGMAIHVRSRLLDFALELQGVVGVNANQAELVEKAATVDTGAMFRTAVFNISGGTAIFGSTNIQVNNQKDDIEGLLQEVAKLGYEKAELEELRQAVIEDKSKNETPTIAEGETSKWYMKALKRVGKGAVDVGVDVASKVIIEALTAFTG
jgi:hypothetical protein